MVMDDIRPFLISEGWRELAVLHSKHGESPGSVFHHFGDEDLNALLIEELAGHNGIEIWIPLGRGVDSSRVAAVREFVSAFDAKRQVG